jgi:glutamate 5-kinase
MGPHGDAREERGRLVRARRVVVKVGSSSLAGDSATFVRLARSIAEIAARGISVVLVSSGAIALGVRKLGYRSRPKEIGKLQAAAAAGQSLLMRAYEEAFLAEGLCVAQVLLTHGDLASRTRANNAQAALVALLDARAIPILNENDSVAVEEIKFGDNDQLASMVVPLVDADLLVLLSDVEGLLDAKGARVKTVTDIDREGAVHVRRSKTAVGTGGMESKLEAARRATLAGACVVIADARQDDTLARVLAGDDVGTLFVPSKRRLSAKKMWIAFTLRPKGELILDAGASEAVCSKGKSILAVGVLGVRGDFRAGESVKIIDNTGREIARGLARFGVAQCAGLAGVQAEGERAVVVHRDEMVLL